MLMLFLFLVSVNGNSIGSTVSDLMSCSKYHFEEQILQKLIRIEHTTELHQISMKTWETKMDEKSKEIDEKIGKVVKQIETDVGEKLKHMDEEDDARRNSFKELKNDIMSELSVIIDNFTIHSENISAVMTYKQDAALKDLKRHFRSQTNLMDNKLLTINNTFETLVEQTKLQTGNQLKKATDKLHDLKVNSNLISGQVTEMVKTVNTSLFTYLQDMGIGSDKVTLTSCARLKTYPAGKYIEFPITKLKRNVSDEVISTLGSKGIFTCEKAGLYLISVFIMTDTHKRNAELYADTTRLAFLYFSPKDFYQTSSVTVLRKLDVNDKVYVKVGSHGEMYILGNQYSCMSILELP